ncbi:pectate lyase superfamily protein-domain-containing protein [Podospora appendiculata]|uniref:Pectate lyase superfamily protein-domain-containing protein n=1 Tax=Podospora appendiculata TaxID=314037 RepID=A0AAE1CAM2_9PEZI|nr:pectate lyase superfamily protein-domain-containing protein [Podospora appendiculata]
MKLLLLVASLWAIDVAAPQLAGSMNQVIDERQSCSGPLITGTPTSWWRAQIKHNGTTPYSSDSTFQYYRTAVQYGADSTGVRDSSDALNSAINAWNRTGNTVTTRPAYIYVPPGRYMIKKPIQMLVSTFLVGDPLDLPTLVADPALGTKPVINGYDAHQGEGSADKNFYMAIRNLQIDMTGIDASVNATAIDWSVSQGCSFDNIHITMPKLSSNHRGVTMNQGGSGILISHSTFTGGAIGLELSNQQYMLEDLQFSNCDVGIYIQRSFVTTIQGCKFVDCRYGVDMGRNGSAGAVSVVDSSIEGCDVGINAFVSGAGGGSLVLDNVSVQDSQHGDNLNVVRSSATGDILLRGSVPINQTWVMGNTKPDGYQSGKMYPVARPPELVRSGGDYFTMPMPQYEEYDISQFISVTGDPQFRVYGDNSHDDGPAINAILAKAAGCKIVFFPQGIYQTKETIYVPPGSRIVGEVLSVISGAGSKFGDAENPQPIVKIGNTGEQGVAQINDIVFSTADVLSGAILVQVNMASDSPGDVGLWNCVLRVGGSIDTLVNSNCQNPDPVGCKAAFALLHITKTASSYLEGVWGWVADHGLDDDKLTQNIAVGRGVLIESTSPTWLIGTSFEHCVLYQYSLNQASNVYIGLQQTESPYWQGKGTPQRAPGPWTANKAYGDPTFDNCARQAESGNDQCYRAWAHYMSNSSNVVIHGSAMWVFFNQMNNNKWQDAGCDSTGGICQLNMAYASDVESMSWYSLSSKSAANLVYDTAASGGTATVTAQDDNQGSWGGVVAAYLRDSGKRVHGDGDGDGQDKSVASGLARGSKTAMLMGGGLGVVLLIL